MIVASNLVEGSMLPTLTRLAGIHTLDNPRLVNLLAVAAPTAAVSQRGDEYRSVLTDVLDSFPENANGDRI